jgi:hypothetical protein
MKNNPFKILLKFFALFLATLIICQYDDAQLKGDHLLGDAGLQAGTQAPPSFTLVLPVYDYNTSTFISANASKIDAPIVNAFLTGVGASIVVNKEILKGHYGASIIFALAANKIDGAMIYSKSSLAFSDTYIQPVQLGWDTKKADFIFGYAIYLPTGKYQLGGSDNSGLGMLSNEFSGGTTYYFDPEKEWNASTLLSYALNSKKKNTNDNDITVGNVLSVEGGIGKTWYRKVKELPLPMIINAGLVYYFQYKITPDKIHDPNLGGFNFGLSKDHIYALGIEGDVFIPKIKCTIGIRWLDEFAAHNRFRGNTFLISLAPYMHFFAPKTQ